MNGDTIAEMDTLMDCPKLLAERIDYDLLTFVQQANLKIPPMFEAVEYTTERDEHGLPKDFSMRWAAYLSSVIFSNSQGVVTLAMHGHDVQAEVFERQGFEALKRLEYYLNNKKEARLQWLAMPWRQKELFDQMGVEASNTLYRQRVADINAIKAKAPEIEAYARSKEISLAKMMNIKGDPVAAREYARRYRQPSQWVHLAVSGSEQFLRRDGTPDIIMNFSSLVAQPNVVLEKVGVTIMALLDLLNQFMGTGFNTEIEMMDAQLGAIMKRLHPEPA